MSDGPTSTQPPETASFAVNAVFPADAPAGAADNINVIRVQVLSVPGDQVLAEHVVEVNPADDAWNIDVSVTVEAGTTQVALLVKLIHRAADGTETVQWSGRTDPITLGGGFNTEVRNVAVVRGPPDNLDVTSVAISPKPVPDIVQGSTSQLTAQAATSRPASAPEVFWSSADPEIASVDEATGLVTAVAPGSTTISAQAGGASDQVTVTVVRQHADVFVSKSVDPTSAFEGETVTFTVVVGNTGPGDATGVKVSDVLPDGLTLVSATPTAGSYAAGTGLWTVGSLAAGAADTLVLKALVADGTAGQTLENTARFLGLLDQIDSNPGNDAAKASLVVRFRALDLAVGKSVSATSPQSGDPLSYTVTVSNAGPATATGVVVADPLPAGVSFVAAAASQGSYTPATGAWSVGSLAPGASATLTLSTGVLAAPGESVTNTARVSAVDQVDETPGNDQASASFAVLNPAVDIALTKTVDDASPKDGQYVTFTVTASNEGPAGATGVTVADLLPNGLLFLGASASQGTYTPSPGTWTVGSLAGGASATLMIDAEVNASPGMTVVNQAAVASVDQLDGNSANDVAAAQVTIQYLPLNRSYATAGNTELVGGGYTAPSTPHLTSATNLLDATPGLTVTSVGTLPTAQGGTIVVLANGDFSYTPPTGFTGSDTFVYTVDTGDSATATFAVSEMVWYVDNRVPGGGSGRSNDPFNDASTGSGAASSGDYVFVGYGDGSAYDGFTAGSGVKIMGEGVALTLPVFGTLVPAGTQPVITSGDGDAIDLDDGAYVAGFHIVNPTGDGIVADDIDSATVTDVTIDMDDYRAVYMIYATGTFTFTNLDINHSAVGQPAFLVDDGDAVVDVTLTPTSFESTGGPAIQIQNTTGGSVTFGGGPITITDGDGIVISDANGAVTVNSVVTITNPTSTGLDIQCCGIGDYSFQELHVTATDQKGVAIDYSEGRKTFGLLDLDVTGANAFEMFDAYKVVVTDPASTISSAGGAALIADESDVGIDLDMTFADVTSTNSIGYGMEILGATGVLTVTDGLLQNADSGAFYMDGGTADITYGGSISQTTTNGRSVEIWDRTDGTVTFNGPITDTDGGILMADNYTASLVTFAGDLTLNTGGLVAFEVEDDEGPAPSGGTVEVTGSNNVVVTGGNYGVALLGADIGPAGVTFKAVSSDGASSGIWLSGVGGTGEFMVTGDGSTAGSGGTISNSTTAGVRLQNVSGVSLSWLQIPGGGVGGSYGVRGTSTVADVTLDHVDISDVGYRGIDITDLQGTSGITNSSVSGSLADNAVIGVTASTLDLDVSGSTFDGGSGAGLILNSYTSGSVSLTASGSSFTNNANDGLSLATVGEGPLGIDISNSSAFTNNGDRGLAVFDSAGSVAIINLDNNTFTQNGLEAINLYTTYVAAASPHGFQGYIQNNTFDELTTVNQSAITAGLQGGTNILVVRDNTGSGGDSNTWAFDVYGALDLTLRDNVFDDDSGTSLHVRASTGSTVCSNVVGNDITNVDAYGIELVQQSTGVFNLEGYPGGSVGAFLIGQNAITITGDGSDTSISGTFGNATCLTPP